MFKRLKERILSSRLVKSVTQWTKEHSLPGFEGIPIYNVGAFVRREVKREGIIIRANAMAFSFYIALFPSLVVLIALVPYLPIDDFVDTVNESVLQLLPDEAARYVIDLVEDFTNSSQTGALSIGVLLTFWFASNGMISMLRGFEKNYQISYDPRSGLKRRLVALQLTVILGLTFLTSMALVVFGRLLLDFITQWVDITAHRYHAILIIRWLATFLLFYAGIGFVYRYGPSMKARIKFISPGTTFATISAILTSIAFSYYINEFGRYNDLYGPIGALIVLMIWMQINSAIILIGYELNAAIQVNKDLAQYLPSDEREAAEELK